MFFFCEVLVKIVQQNQKKTKKEEKFVHTFIWHHAILIGVNPNTLYSFCYTPLVTKIPSPEEVTSSTLLLLFFLVTYSQLRYNGSKSEKSPVECLCCDFGSNVGRSRIWG